MPFFSCIVCWMCSVFVFFCCFSFFTLAVEKKRLNASMEWSKRKHQRRKNWQIQNEKGNWLPVHDCSIYLKNVFQSFLVYHVFEGVKMFQHTHTHTSNVCTYLIFLFEHAELCVFIIIFSYVRDVLIWPFKWPLPTKISVLSMNSYRWVV